MGTMSFRRGSGHTGMKTQMLETTEAEIAYDVRGPLPTVDGRPPLFMIGQPMDASGFTTLASYFPDRTVITYDPRGLGIRKHRDERRLVRHQGGDVVGVFRHEREGGDRAATAREHLDRADP